MYSTERRGLNVGQIRLLVQLKLRKSTPFPFEQKLALLHDREGPRCLALELSDLSLPPHLTLSHFCSPSTLTEPQQYWPPCCSSNSAGILPPLALCNSCCLSLEYSSLRCWNKQLLHHTKRLHKHHFQRATSEKPI